MGVSFVEIVVLLMACGAVVAALRKPTWVTLLLVPFGLLVLFSIGIVTWSRAAPRHVYLPDRRVESQNWEVEQAASVMHNMDRSSPHVTRLNTVVLGLPLLLGGAGCVTVLLVLKRTWLAQHANVVLPLVAIGFAGLLVVGGAALYFVRMEDREDALRATRRAELRAMEEDFRHRSAGTDVVQPALSEPVMLDADERANVATEGSIASSEETATNAESEAKVAVTDLPQWARGETVDWRKLRDGVDQNTVVLVSDQWSSVQETEIQLEAMAVRALQQQLLMDRGSYRWQPSKDFVHQSGAIQQRFVEQTSLKVGEFETPMYRSYWQVAATPYVSSLAQKEWKAAAVEERLTLLGAAAAVLTLLFAGGAAGLRFDSATGGRYRRRMAAAAVAVGALAAGTAALFVA